MDRVTEMQIWHFCRSPVTPYVERGGVSNVVAALAQENSESGITTHVVCSNQDLGLAEAQVGDVEYGPSLNVHTVYQHKNLLTGPYAELKRHVNSIPSNAIAHVHGCFSAFTELSMYLLYKRSVPFIFSPHGKLSPGMITARGRSKRVMWHCVTKRVARHAKAAGLFSNQEGVLFGSLGLNIPRVTIPNGYRGIEESLFSACPVLSGRYILFLGFLDPRKRPALLIESFAMSQARHSHRLIFVGPDSYRHQQQLEAKVAGLDLIDQVYFYGPAHGSKKWNILINAACVCLPSRAEGMPLVLIEALGALAPTVFSQSCNASELSDAGTGVEVETDSASDWAAAIDSVTLDVSVGSRMKVNALNIREGYQWKSIARRWVDAYGAISNRNDQP